MKTSTLFISSLMIFLLLSLSPVYGRMPVGGTEQDTVLFSSEKKILLSNAEKQTVIRRAEVVNRSTKKKFKKLFTTWSEEIKKNPKMVLSSNTRDYTTLQGFKDLQAMGKGIIPLIMEELMDSQKCYLLQLYDALQDDPHLKLVGNGIVPGAGEQDRAIMTIQLWLRNQQQ